MEYYFHVNLMIWCDLQLIILSFSLNTNQLLVALVLWMLHNFLLIWYSNYHNYTHSFFKVYYKIKKKGHEDICTIIPAFYMHAVMKCKKKNADVSYNIQLSGPYKCPTGCTIGCWWEILQWKTYLKKDPVTSDCSGTQTHNHLVHKWTLNHFRPVWLNGWVFVYELSVCGFESCCSHLNFKFPACFEQGIPWQSDNYRVWIHSEMCMW